MSALIKKLLNYLLIGILAVIPIVLILQIIIFVKDRVADLFQLVYGYSVSYVYTSLIFAVSFIILVSIGRQIAKQGRPWFIAAFEHVIERIPFLNTVYRVIKKVVNMFSSHDKSIAKEVVYVEYPKDGIWVPAYVTNRFNEKYVLFVPTSPNPTSGFTVIVDKSKIIRSNMNIEEATSFIVSVGVDFNKDTEVSQLPR